jgi:hypothetical protein
VDDESKLDNSSKNEVPKAVPDDLIDSIIIPVISKCSI